MGMRIKHSLILLVVLGLLSLNTFGQKKKKDKLGKESLVLIQTDFGDIKIKLYNQTPIHRDNFLKLVEEGLYDSTLFHRVIPQFMIQGGDPDSKGAKEGTKLGDGGMGYTLEAEFVDSLIHKRGALAAARMPDNVNPEKRSSSSKFYIVQGRKFSEANLSGMAQKQNYNMKGQLMNEFFNRPENKAYLSRLQTCQKEKDDSAMQLLMQEIEPLVDREFEPKQIKFHPRAIEAYTTVGGAPHLDGGYTVFGEVVEGMDVVDAISAQSCDRNNRPLKDVSMKVKAVKR